MPIHNMNITVSTKNISKSETHIYLLFHHFLALRRTLLLVSIKSDWSDTEHKKYEYLFGQKRIIADLFILILLGFFFIIAYEFRGTFQEVGEDIVGFLKMYLVFSKIKERKYIFKQIQKQAIFEQANRNETDTLKCIYKKPIDIIDITENEING